MKKEAWGKEKKIRSVEKREEEDQKHRGKRTRRTAPWRKENKKNRNMEEREEEGKHGGKRRRKTEAIVAKALDGQRYPCPA